MHIALITYSTANMATVFVGPRPPHDLKVRIEITKEMANIIVDVVRSSHTERTVPSS